MKNFKDFESKFLNEEVLTTFKEFSENELVEAIPAFMTFTNMKDIVEPEVGSYNGVKGKVWGVNQVKEMIGRLRISNPDVKLFKNNTLE